MFDLFFYHPNTVWVLIPLVAIIGGIITKTQRIRAESARSGAMNEGIAAELRDSIRRLEERVANLERAVTTAETERKFAL